MVSCQTATIFNTPVKIADRSKAYLDPAYSAYMTTALPSITYLPEAEVSRQSAINCAYRVHLTSKIYVMAK